MCQDTGHAPEAKRGSRIGKYSEAKMEKDRSWSHEVLIFTIWIDLIFEISIWMNYSWRSVYSDDSATSERKAEETCRYIQYMYQPFKWRQHQMLFFFPNWAQFFRLRGDEGKGKHIRRGEKLQIWRGLQQWLGARACPTFRAANPGELEWCRVVFWALKRRFWALAIFQTHNNLHA